MLNSDHPAEGQKIRQNSQISERRELKSIRLIKATRDLQDRQICLNNSNNNSNLNTSKRLRLRGTTRTKSTKFSKEDCLKQDSE